MASRLKIWMDRLNGREVSLASLDFLASSANPRDTLEHRLNWLVDLVQWIRRPGTEPATQAQAHGAFQAGRLRRLLDMLDKNPEWKLQVARTLRSIIREMQAIDLFSETGLPRQNGLLHELGERISATIMPPPLDSAELGVLFNRLFPTKLDDDWIESLDDALLERLWALLDHEVTPEEQDWNALKRDLDDAMIHVTAQLRVNGCGVAIRTRIKRRRIQELPFFKLGTVMQSVLAARNAGDHATLNADLNYLRSSIESCYRVVEEVFNHLEENGVSTEVVYQLTYIEALLKRLEALMDLTFHARYSVPSVRVFVANLVRENQARQSLSDLLRQNSRLLTRKMIEHNAEAGEHYIARSRGQYFEMLRRASGGGAVMAVTTWLKTVIVGFHLAGLMQGVLASLNYSLGFVGIQLLGYTVATKQPATTAPAIAAKMHQVRDPQAMNALVDEVVCLIRSQFAAIIGNIALVVPAVVMLQFIIFGISGSIILSDEKARKTIESVSILGPSAFYAGLTGILLWSSSIIGAWVANGFTYHKLGNTLANSRRLTRLLGPSRAARFARFLKKNMAGFGSNISLGFMLGVLPEIAIFAGLPLDVRHVTLSSGLLSAAVMSLGPAVMLAAPFWLAVLGVMSIGLMNVAVSFALAMFVAIRARGVQAPERRAIYEALLQRVRREPFSFILPVGSSVSNAPAKAH